MAILLSDWCKDAVQQLQDTGIDSALLDVRLLACHALGCDAGQWMLLQNKPLNPEHQKTLNALLQHRLAQEPMAYILGYRDFWKDRFLVTPEVLIPRPDSETLIQAVIEQSRQYGKPKTILDIGTGSGCLLLSVLAEFSASIGTGLDCSYGALQVARHNAMALKRAQRCHFVCGNWLETLQTRYDMIITNPPYIKTQLKAELSPEVRDYEPGGALWGGDDGLQAYREILSTADRLLKDNGLLLLELGAGQADSVKEIAQQNGWVTDGLWQDLAGIDRVLSFTR